jgi:hypothetical protein
MADCSQFKQRLLRLQWGAQSPGHYTAGGREHLECGQSGCDAVQSDFCRYSGVHIHGSAWCSAYAYQKVAYYLPATVRQ